MARQKRLPGIADDDVPKAVRLAGEVWVTERDKRMRQSKKEKEAKNALIAAMKEHKVKIFKDPEADPPVIIALSQTDDVKATKVVDEVEEEEAETAEEKAEKKEEAKH